MARLPVPDNARGRVRTSSFFELESDAERKRWRRGWWDAYDGVDQDEGGAYARGWTEHFVEYGPPGPGRNRPMTATQTPTEIPIEVRRWTLEALCEHPQNPRSKEESAAAIEEMRRSIEQHGQLQPALVRTDGLVISGHVRKWANEALGRETMPCVEIDCDDATALALLLASNEHITPPDPFLEADAVEELLHPKTPGVVAWTVDQVADALGRKRSWVARRAQLRNLTPAFRKAIEEGKVCKGWPVPWLEQLAILRPKDQDEILAEAKRHTWGGVHDLENEKELVAFLGDYLHILSAAPFDPRDSELVPKAGPCVAPAGEPACPKTTLSRPGLFEDQVEGDVRTARCCDAKCWATKCAARVKADVAAAEEKHGTVLVVQPHGSEIETGQQAVEALGRNAVQPYQVKEVKAASKGAEAAVFVDPDGSTREAWVQRVSSPTSGGYSRAAKPAKPAAEKTDAQRLKDSKEHIRCRRIATMIDAVGEAVRDSKMLAPPLDVVLGFVAAYEVEAPRKSDYNDRFHADVKKAREYSAIADDPAKLAAQLWARLRPAVAQSIARHGNHMLEEELELACWIAERIGLSPTVLAVTAVHDVPAPRFWPEGADVGAAAHLVPKSWRAAAPAKGKKVKGAKAPAADPPAADAAPTPGTCRKCGCTETTPCVDALGDGCYWVHDAEVSGPKDVLPRSRTLCSACPRTEKAPKARKPAKARKAKR